MPAKYAYGHYESVLRSHVWRTAENSAGYLLPHLSAGQSLLDVGSGPGTITIDLASRVAPGRVMGIDSEPGVVDSAEALRRERSADNVAFATGDVYQLDFDDASFDVVHAHQVLQHLADPVAALVEMRRVLRPGGLLAVRDSDYGGFTWAPADPLLDRWNKVTHQVVADAGGNSDAGRYLLGWVQRAGFASAEVSSSTWTFADPEDRAWWGGLWADRMRDSAVPNRALELGLTTADELAAISLAWLNWAAQPDGIFVVLHVEVLARR